MLTIVMGGIAAVAALLAMLTAFAVASAGVFFVGLALALALVGTSVAPLVDDPY